jgi:prepilin-type N-terminal cleavage/methylation domain-containing protein
MLSLHYRNAKKGVTIVEIVVVVIILAIIGTISFFSYKGFLANARD